MVRLKPPPEADDAQDSSAPMHFVTGLGFRLALSIRLADRLPFGQSVGGSALGQASHHFKCRVRLLALRQREDVCVAGG